MRHKNNNVAKIEIRSERIQGIMKEELSRDCRLIQRI